MNRAATATTMSVINITNSSNRISMRLFLRGSCPSSSSSSSLRPIVRIRSSITRWKTTITTTTAIAERKPSLSLPISENPWWFRQPRHHHIMMVEAERTAVATTATTTAAQVAASLTVAAGVGEQQHQQQQQSIFHAILSATVLVALLGHYYDNNNNNNKNHRITKMEAPVTTTELQPHRKQQQQQQQDSLRNNNKMNINHSNNNDAIVFSDAVCDMFVSVLQRDYSNNNNKGGALPQRRRRILYLLGTAHDSLEAARLAQNLVQDVRPHAVFVEFDLPRILAWNDYQFVRFIQINNPTTTNNSSINKNSISTTQLEQFLASSKKLFINPDNMLVPTTPWLGWKDEDDDNNNKQNQERKPRLYFRTPKIPSKRLIDANKIRPKTIHGNAKNTTQPATTTTNISSDSTASSASSSAAAVTSRTKPTPVPPTGNEFYHAMKEAVKIGAVVVLGDRDIHLTTEREALATSHGKVRFKTASDLESYIRMQQGRAEDDDDDDNNDDDVDSTATTTSHNFIKNKEKLDAVRKQPMKRIAPLYHEVVVKERDEYMAVGIAVLDQFPVMVAVVGAGHLRGMEDFLQQDYGWQVVPKQQCLKPTTSRN